MKLAILKFKKRDFEKLSDDEQIFIINNSWIYTEITILRKLILFSGNSKDKTGYELTATRIQNLFFYAYLQESFMNAGLRYKNYIFRKIVPDKR